MPTKAYHRFAQRVAVLSAALQILALLGLPTELTAAIVALIAAFIEVNP